MESLWEGKGTKSGENEGMSHQKHYGKLRSESSTTNALQKLYKSCRRTLSASKAAQGDVDVREGAKGEPSWRGPRSREVRKQTRTSRHGRQSHQIDSELKRGLVVPIWQLLMQTNRAIIAMVKGKEWFSWRKFEDETLSIPHSIAITIAKIARLLSLHKELSNRDH